MNRGSETVIIKAPPIEPIYLRPSKAAALLDCGRTKIYDLIHSGELKAITIGGQLRIPRSEIEALANRPSAE